MLRTGDEPDHMHPTELAQGHTEAPQGAVPNQVGMSRGGVEAEDSEAADAAPTEPTEGRIAAIQEAAVPLEPAQGQAAAEHATEPDHGEVLCKGGASANSGWEE